MFEGLGMGLGLGLGPSLSKYLVNVSSRHSLLQMISGAKWHEIDHKEVVVVKERSVWMEIQSIESTLYPEVLKIKTIIVVKQNL